MGCSTSWGMTTWMTIDITCELIRRAVAGEEEAFGLVYERCLPEVKRFLLGMRMPLAPSMAHPTTT